MELRELWKVVLRRWWLIALPTLAALAFVAYGAASAPPASTYTTGIRFTAATPPEDEDTQGYEDAEYYPWLTSEYVINALTDWARTGSFAAEISAALAEQGIEIPAAAIQPNISADNERSIMVLYINWPDSEQLAAIAETAVFVLEEKSPVYFPQFGDGGVEVVPLDAPAVGRVPPPLSSRLDPLVRIAVGLAAGVGLAFLIEYLDPTIRERREVERMDMPVLAVVPRHRGK
jgi:capsular polysaccharide biosynthesis protein